jgi:glutamyl-tRNA synthetase
MIARLRGHLLSDNYLAQIWPLCRERVDTLEGFFEYANFFFVGEVAYDDGAMAGLVPKSRTATEAAKALAALIERRIDPLLTWTAETVEAELRAFSEDCGWPVKDLLMTVRVAVTGRAATPPLFETMAVLGKEICRRRLRRAADALKSSKPPA